MICLICRQAQTSSESISVDFARDEMKLTVKRIPAYACPSCGEGYLEEDIATSLLRGAELIFLSGSIENSYDYEELISL